ncbi:hypothetical protein [Sphingomonas sp.]|nr:hypothetical protein [Sphingomonas sp.]HTG39134.1 hypothetical protein [Sphingomonas sp.]
MLGWHPRPAREAVIAARQSIPSGDGTNLAGGAPDPRLLHR